MPNACEIDVPEQENSDPSYPVPEGLAVEGSLVVANPHDAAASLPSNKSSSNKSPSNSLIKNFTNKNHKFAKNLHEAAYIYALYGMLDGLSLSYSMIKYFFDLLHKDSPLTSTDEMHNWMTTPAGIAVAAVESVALIAFSMLANFFDDKSKNAFKRYIAVIWPYCRDTLQGLKNAYKGVRGALQAVNLLVGQDLRYLMLPVGLALGAFSVLNRIWLRRMRAERKVMQSENADLLREIQATCSLHLMTSMPEEVNTETYKNSYIFVGKTLYYVKPDGTSEEVPLDNIDKFSKDLDAKNKDKKAKLYLDKQLTDDLITSNGGHRPTFEFVTEAACEAFRKKTIGRQSASLRSLGLLSAAYNGVVDGVYLYMGTMGLTALVPPVFVVMFVFSVLFTLTCVATRMYEEYDYQRKLVATSAQVELAICGKELELLFSKLHQLSERRIPAPENQLPGHIFPVMPNSSESSPEEIEAEKLFHAKEQEFDRRHAFFRSQQTLSHHSAVLAGLQNGLAAYSAIASVMFAVAAICFIASVSFPPVFFVVCMAAGMACLIGFVAHALITNHAHRCDQKPKEMESKKTLSTILAEMKNKRLEVETLGAARVKDAISDRIAVDPSPQFYIQESCEMFRAAASGLSKAPKVVGYALNQLQQSDSAGHYHDTTIMIWITGVSAAIYAVVLALRAHARGFNQKKPTIEKFMPKVAAVIAPDDSESQQQLSESTEQLSESTEQLSESTEQLSESTEQLSESTEQLSESIEQLSELTTVSSASTELSSEWMDLSSESTEQLPEQPATLPEPRGSLGREDVRFVSIGRRGADYIVPLTANSLPEYRLSPTGHTPAPTHASFRFFTPSPTPSSTPTLPCSPPSPPPSRPTPRSASTPAGISTPRSAFISHMRSASAGNLTMFNSPESITPDLMKRHCTF